MTPEFIGRYRELSPELRRLTKKAFKLFQRDPGHPSLQFKIVQRTKRKRARVWEARITSYYRALARREGDLLLWFTIITKPEFERHYGR